jgi:hypothetical protein
MVCMPRMADCGGLTIGVDISEPNVPPLVIGEGAALQIVQAKFAVARLFGVISDGLFDISKRHRFGVANDRRDQSLVSGPAIERSA